MILSDRTLTALSDPDQQKPLIEPFEPTSVSRSSSGDRIASYGVSSYGYDIRSAPEFYIFKHAPHGGVLDYKELSQDCFEYIEAPSVLVPPNGFVLSRSLEYIRMPRNVLALCIGKSTIARAGLNCLCTPLEPDWEGFITLEFSNTTGLPNRFYAHEGVMQLVFIQGDQDCQTSYGDRSGKYQHQEGKIILPKV